MTSLSTPLARRFISVKPSLLKAVKFSAIPLVLCFSYCAVFNHFYNRRSAAIALNIGRLPDTVKVLGCDGPTFSTDILNTCSLSFPTGDLPILLSGYHYKRYSETGTSHSVVSTRVGPTFQVVEVYSVSPDRFKNGGEVQVFVNAEKTRAIVDLYIE